MNMLLAARVMHWLFQDLQSSDQSDAMLLPTAVKLTGKRFLRMTLVIGDIGNQQRTAVFIAPRIVFGVMNFLRTQVFATSSRLLRSQARAMHIQSIPMCTSTETRPRITCRSKHRERLELWLTLRQIDRDGEGQQLCLPRDR